MKRFFYFFGWTIFIGFIIYLGVKYQQFLIWQEFLQNTQKESSSTFIQMPVVLFTFLFSIVVGIMLRLPKFIDELKKNKQWKFDWMKFIAIGLPSFCIALTHLQFYLPEGITVFTSQITLFSDSTVQLIAGIAFGYVLIDSLKK